MTAHTRRTSPYFLRILDVPHTDRDTVLALLAGRVQAVRLVTDQHTHTTDPTTGHGYVSVGFRATDDADAATVAIYATRGLPGTAAGPRYPDTALLTGYGIHRRTVTQ